MKRESHIETEITLTDKDINQLKKEGTILVDEGVGIWIRIWYTPKLDSE